MYNFTLKSQAVVEKTANKIRELLFAAPDIVRRVYINLITKPGSPVDR